MNQDQTVLIFIHIPKTAGGTFNNILHQHYPQDHLYRYEAGEEARRTFDSLPVHEKDKLHAIYGHLYFGLHEQLSRPHLYITFLRNPIERLISAYYFIRERSHHPYYEMATKLSLREYYEQGYGGKEQDNGQTRILSGQYDMDEPCNAGMLELAKKNLSEEVEIVGLTERFDESLMMIANRLNWHYPYYYNRNVAAKRPAKSEIPSDILSFLEQYNQYDMELYQFATELFEKALKNEHDDFQKQVKQFQFLNNLYKFPFRIFQGLKSLRS